MVDRSSSPNPRKNSDSSSLFLDIARVFSLKKVSRARTLTKSSDKDKNITNEDFDTRDFTSFNKYAFPSSNDDEFDLEHYLFRFQWQSNFSSPIEQNLLSGGVKVLDIGCGTGAWILDMAREYPNSNTFVGIDISPIFPDESFRFPNTGFIQCDLRNGIPFPDSTFDFVYERFVAYHNLTVSQWKYLFSEMKRVLKPGGYIEIMEYCVGFDNPGPITQTRNTQVLKYLNSKGIDPETTINSIPQMMQSSSLLSDFCKQDKVCRIGRWGGEFGLMMLKSYEIAQKTLNKRFQPGLTEEETEDMIASSAKEFDNYKTQIGNFRCFARKKPRF